MILPHEESRFILQDKSHDFRVEEHVDNLHQVDVVRSEQHFQRGRDKHKVDEDRQHVKVICLVAVIGHSSLQTLSQVPVSDLGRSLPLDRHG